MRWKRLGVLISLGAVLAASAAAQTAPPPGTRPPPAKTRLLAPTGAQREALQVLKKRASQNAALAALARTNGIDIETVNQSAIPVLVVPTGALAANLSIVATKDHYVASSGDEITGVVITGTRITTAIDGPSKVTPLDPRLAALLAKLQGTNSVYGIQDPVFSDSEDGVALSFRRIGMLYDMRISCAKVKDPHCTPEAVLQLATQTLVLGGGQ